MTASRYRVQMKQNMPPRRSRGRSNMRSGRAPAHRNQALESNGPEGRVRGTAQQILDRYLAMARDAQSGGDSVLAENPVPACRALSAPGSAVCAAPGAAAAARRGPAQRRRRSGGRGGSPTRPRSRRQVFGSRGKRSDRRPPAPPPPPAQRSGRGSCRRAGSGAPGGGRRPGRRSDGRGGLNSGSTQTRRNFLQTPPAVPISVFERERCAGCGLPDRGSRLETETDIWTSRTYTERARGDSSRRRKAWRWPPGISVSFPNTSSRSCSTTRRASPPA